jgi:hypothetical protein
MEGHPKPISDPLNKARAKVSIDKQFQQFKMLVRKIVDRACFKNGEADWFKPCKLIHPNLKGVGLEGKHPAICLNLAIADPAKLQLARKLLTIGAHHNKTDIDAFLKGENGESRRTQFPGQKQLGCKHTPWTKFG